MNLHSLIGEKLADQLADIKNHENTTYTDSVIFHCYWNKEIEMNQLFSILSCYLTNVKDTNNKIILWTDFNIDLVKNKTIYLLLSEYCEIRYFNHIKERIETPLDNHDVESGYLNIPSFYSDYVRLILLSKYGGMWFDLDIIFFKSFDYLFSNYDTFVMTWGSATHPNGPIFWSRNKELIDEITNRFIKHGCGHLGFQDSFMDRGENQLHFSLESDLGLTVLPCGWFDPMFCVGIKDTIPEDWDFANWFKDNNNEYFYDDAYCYHWHNRNHLPIEENSPFARRIKILIEELGLQNIISS